MNNLTKLRRKLCDTIVRNWDIITYQCFEKISKIWFGGSVADPSCLSRIPGPNFSIPDPNFFHSGYVSRNLGILTPNFFFSSRKYDPGCSSRIRIQIFYPSWIQRSKAPDPGSGSATLVPMSTYSLIVNLHRPATPWQEKYKDDMSYNSLWWVVSW